MSAVRKAGLACRGLERLLIEHSTDVLPLIYLKENLRGKASYGNTQKSVTVSQ